MLKLIKYDFEMVIAKIFSILDENALKEGEKNLQIGIHIVLKNYK